MCQSPARALWGQKWVILPPWPWSPGPSVLFLPGKYQLGHLIDWDRGRDRQPQSLSWTEIPQESKACVQGPHAGGLFRKASLATGAGEGTQRYTEGREAHWGARCAVSIGHHRGLPALTLCASGAHRELSISLHFQQHMLEYQAGSHKHPQLNIQRCPRGENSGSAFTWAEEGASGMAGTKGGPATSASPKK